MPNPLEELLTAAASHHDEDVQFTFDYVANLCYRTKGEANRPAGLKTILEGLYASITTENFEQTVNWSCIIAKWIVLEHNVPRKVRSALARIYYDLALTPGMDGRSAGTFSTMVIQLVRYV